MGLPAGRVRADAGALARTCPSDGESEGFFQWEHIRQVETMEPDEWMAFCGSTIEYSSVEAAYGVLIGRE